ncbi:MAG TPA: rhomboid family intramembrane serine protease [Planctomycetes bacterium]|nr:rhomboid family intramembrane serine protease [Planctomycetota bacterium]
MFPLHDDNPITRPPVVTVGLIVVNSAVFLFTLFLPEAKLQELYYRRGFVPARLAQLRHGLPLKVPIQQEVIHPLVRLPVRVQRWIRLDPDPPAILLSLVTCMFLHGGWFHLIGNMWFLWVFGNNVEDRLGSMPFLVFYLCGGLAASFCHWRIGPDSTLPVIGASGAVAAVLGAYAITWPWARVHTLVVLVVFITIVDLPALLVLGFWFLGQLLEAQKAVNLGVDGGVAWWAHVGGFVAGTVMMLVFGGEDDRRVRRPRKAVVWDDDELDF